MSASKSVGVALVEQCGALIAMAAYLVVVQHIMMASVLHRPQDSWLIQVRDWWRRKQEELEQKSLHVWTLDPITDEPRVTHRED